jgi:hypothetical protein
MPRVKTTRMVKLALWAIRIYLLVLLTLIGLKFLRVSQRDGGSSKPAQTSVEKPAGTKP